MARHASAHATHAPTVFVAANYALPTRNSAPNVGHIVIGPKSSCSSRKLRNIRSSAYSFVITFQGLCRMIHSEVDRRKLSAIQPHKMPRCRVTNGCRRDRKKLCHTVRRSIGQRGGSLRRSSTISFMRDTISLMASGSSVGADPRPPHVSTATAWLHRYGQHRRSHIRSRERRIRRSIKPEVGMPAVPQSAAP